MNRNADLKVPFSPGGYLMHHPGKRVSDDGKPWPGVGEWRENEVFTATLRLTGTERGRSAAFFRWRVVTADRLDMVDTSLPMFITDVGHILMRGLDVQPGGIISGRWFVVKRGQNYGITPADDTPTTASGRPRENTEQPAPA